MANAYAIAEQHLETNIAAAAAENVDLNAYGQALIWKVIEANQKAGRKNEDIIDEIKYTLDNIADDGTFHVSRN
jgi:flagellar biosynthesis/type III secretory pathway chaperone